MRHVELMNCGESGRRTTARNFQAPHRFRLCMRDRAKGAMAWAATAVGLFLLAVTPAPASTVSVSETPGETNQALLSYQAGPGEHNHLTASIAGKEDGRWRVRLVDPGAEIASGAGCSAGSTSAEATCTMHEPKGFDFGPCSGHDCIPPKIPGTAWAALATVALGDGDNYFDGSAFTDMYTESLTMTITSGAGKDSISAGGGYDSIDPGPGSDIVRTGQGHDRIQATAIPDGPDTYESGPSNDTLNYASRTVPVELHDSLGGAAGEKDQVLGYFSLVGGAADDVLIGGADNYILEGGSGNDTLVAGFRRGSDLIGGPGDDRLSSVPAGAETITHMFGEEGNDTYYGGPGTNMMRESTGATAGYGPASGPSSGNDVAYGGEGQDFVELRGGDDLAYGGSGNDGLHGGMGEDRLFGGAGGDFAIGGSGFDRLYGGSGRDQLFSGWWAWNFPSPKRTFPFASVGDDGPDRVDCGLGSDQAFSNPRDRLYRCESQHLRPHRKHRGKR